MARPANPLDKYVTYTYHFELHVAKSFEEIAALIDTDANSFTSPRQATNTLLINTRRDFHQQIDNVRFKYASPFLDPNAALVPISKISLSVTEPNGTFFTEKLVNKSKDLDVTDFSNGMCYGLKIFFIGRVPGENAEPKTEQLPGIIAMQLINMNGRFDHRGSEYQMEFVNCSHALHLSPYAPSNALAKVAGYVNKNLTIKALTVGEALGELQSQLNGNYTKTYQTELSNDSGSRFVEYKINNVGSWNGKLDLITSDSFAPGEKMKLTFNPSVSVIDMCRQILTSSKDVNAAIGASRPNVKKPYHTGVSVPIFIPSYHLKPDKLEIVIDIHRYDGGGDTYEFDYFFADPGKCVDIIEFEVRFPHVNIWMSSAAKAAVQMNTNQDSTIPSLEPQFYKDNLMHPDITRPELLSIPHQKYPIPTKSGDIAFLNALPRVEKAGWVKNKYSSVAAGRLAIETMSDLASAVNPQFTFTIRGHLDFLTRCLHYPDDSKQAFGVKDGLWIKVNIRDQTGEPFYYTGVYQLLTVENIFVGGKFTQLLTVVAMDQ